MDEYLTSTWRDLLVRNGLADFESLWNLQLPWFEAPNHRRGGWSGVARCELAADDGSRFAFFLKRQENHVTFSWRHPLRGMPTFLREFRLIQRYHAAGVPTLDPVYFGISGQRAMLMTVALDGFLSLDRLGDHWRPNRRGIITAVALLTRKLHDAHIQHNCYYPKHVFVKVGTDGTADARVIDLEKSRGRPLKILCTLRDLDTLNRHAFNWRRTERLRFLKAYLGTEQVTPHTRWLWQLLARRAAADKKR